MYAHLTGKRKGGCLETPQVSSSFLFLVASQVMTGGTMPEILYFAQGRTNTRGTTAGGVLEFFGYLRNTDTLVLL